MNKESHRSFWTNPIVIFLGVFQLFFGVQIIAGTVVALLKDQLTSNNQQLAVFVCTSLVLLLVLLSTFFKLTGFSWRSIGFVKPSLKAVASVIPAFIIYFAISTVFTVVAVKLIPGFKADETQDIGFKNLHHTSELIIGFISLVVLTPIFEETIFRGVLFRGLRKRWPFWIATVITSALFAVAHGQWNVALDTFALSIIMCVLVEKSGSIVPSMLLHAAKNSVAFVFLFLLPK